MIKFTKTLDMALDMALGLALGLAKSLGIAMAFAMSLAVFGSAVAADHPAQQLVENSVAELLLVMREDGERIRSEPEFLQQKLEEIVVPHLDFLSMTKLSIGKYWRRASDEQKEQLVIQFKQFLLNTYASAVNEYKGGEVKFDPFQPASREDRAVVKSVFQQSGSEQIPVVYKLRDKKGWQIYDIEVSQLSLVTNYRSSFSNEIDQNGIDGLISLLKERNGG